MDVVTVLQGQAARTSTLVDSVPPDHLGLPTPCSDWTVRDLINHLCLVAQFCARVASGEQVEPDYETDFVGDDPSGAYRRWQKEMLEACTAPGLAERTVYMMGQEFPGAVVLALALMDTVVHRSDLSRAIGVDPEIDPGVAALVLEQVRPFIPDEMRAPAPDETTGTIPFGPVVEVPDDAPPLDRLLAFLGRTP